MALLSLLACGVDIPEDTAWAPTDGNVLEGEVVLAGTDAEGPVAVLLAAADDPLPPSGTGNAVDFGMVPQAAFTDSTAGLQAAPWAITGVPDGDWLLNALMDADGDFNPLLTATRGATCGDWAGAYVADLETGEAATLHVEGGERMDDVTLLVGAPMTFERPAFQLVDTYVDQTSALATFNLTATAIHSELTDLAGPYDGGADTCQTGFLFYAVDADGDGAPDPNPDPDLAAAGFYDVWPHVYLQDEADPTWATQAMVYPTPLLDGTATPGVPALLTSLTLVFLPVAQHGDETVSAPDLPAGEWSVTVVNVTGQTWTVPNETADVASTADGWDRGAQGIGLTVQ